MKQTIKKMSTVKLELIFHPHKYNSVKSNMSMILNEFWYIHPCNSQHFFFTVLFLILAKVSSKAGLLVHCLHNDCHA